MPKRCIWSATSSTTGVRLGAQWSDEHELVLKLLLGRARAGRRIVYVPGNHDDFFRRYLGRYFDELDILPEAWHVTVGRRAAAGDAWRLLRCLRQTPAMAGAAGKLVRGGGAAGELGG